MLEPRVERIRAVAILALMPFLSAFAYESSRYVGRKDPTVAQALKPHEGMLVASRMRAKITEDKYRPSAEVLDNANELAKTNSGWFMEGYSL